MAKAKIEIIDSKLFMSARYKPEEKDNICVICRMDINECSIYSKEIEPNNLTQINCGHLFHTDCLSKWQKKQNKCPLCKKRITTTCSCGNCHDTLPQVDNEPLPPLQTEDTVPLQTENNIINITDLEINTDSDSEISDVD